MALDTFSGLKSVIADYLARDDLTTQIPDFIRLAESRMDKELRVRELIKRATTTTTTGDDTVNLPTDFLGALDLFIEGSPKQQLSYVTPSQYSAVYGGSVVGKPKIYTVLGKEARLGPKPDTNYTLEILYHQRIPNLSDSQTTNDILTNYPELYLYGALVEAEPFLQNDARVQTWLSLYGNAVSAASISDEGGKFTGVLRAMSLYGD